MSSDSEEGKEAKLLNRVKFKNHHFCEAFYLLPGTTRVHTLHYEQRNLCSLFCAMIVTCNCDDVSSI